MAVGTTQGDAHAGVRRDEASELPAQEQALVSEAARREGEQALLAVRRAGGNEYQEESPHAPATMPKASGATQSGFYPSVALAYTARARPH